MTDSANSSNMLEVGVAAHEGLPSELDWAKVAEAAARSAILRRQNREMPARLLVLLATPEWCRPGESLSLLIREAVERQLGYPVPLIGGSTPRVFVSIPDTDSSITHHIHQGFVLVALFSNDLWAAVEKVEKPYDLSDADREQRLAGLATRLLDTRTTHMTLGSSAAIDLFAILPGPFLDVRGERTFRDLELHHEINGAFRDAVMLFGGSAANDVYRPTTGYQFADDVCLESGLAVALLEHDFKTGGAMAHGFGLVPDMMLSVDELGDPNAASDYVVRKLDGEDAAIRLKRLMVEVGYSCPRPILGLGASAHPYVLVPLETPDRWDRAVRFNRKLHRGYRLTVLNATNQELHQRGHEAFDIALRKTGSTREHVQFAFSFACLGRFAKFDSEEHDSWWEALDTLSGEHVQGLPFVCALVAGEFAEDHRRRGRGDNMSLWIAYMTGAPNGRARNRLLQVRLLEAARRVLEQRSPDNVMRVAIGAAIDIGASGGQVCVCDPMHGLILGGRHGFAASTTSSGEDFKAVLAMTNRKLAPKDTCYRLSEKMHRWSVRIGDRSPDCREQTLTSDIDILTIVAANRIAIYIPSSRDPAFHCDLKAVESGKLGAQFIMPLVGSDSEVLGTLQIAFPLDNDIDREMVGLWIGFGQKVATALERALEADEREATQRINALGSEIMQRSIPDHEALEREIQDFLVGIQTEIKADYIHARVRETGDDKVGRYRLVALDTNESRDHKQHRRLISSVEGSMRHAIERQEIFTLTRDETEQLYPELPIGEMSSDRQSLRDWHVVLCRYKTVANVILGTKQDPLGCLVLHSANEYFFTSRRRRLVSQAAARLKAIITKKEADQIEKRRKELERTILNRGFWGAKTIHDLMRPLTNINKIAEMLLRNPSSDNRRPITDILLESERMINMLKTRAEGVDLGSNVYTVQQLVETAMADLTLAQRNRLQPKVINAATDERVETNFWLRSAITNLMDNAVESAAHHNSDVTVTVSCERGARDFIVICIENGGPMLTPSDVERMRQPGHSTKDGHLGLGVPLAEAGIASVDGELRLLPRQKGGLQALVRLPALRERLR